MKDIYELLNDADIDLSQYDKTELSDIEKKKFKKRLHNNIKLHSNIKPRGNSFFNLSKIAAAVLCFFAVSGFALFKSAPTLAVGIPVVGNIIKHITGYDYAEFDKYTSVINKAVDKDGINVTLDEVMLDKNELRIASTFKSNGQFKTKSVITMLPKVYINGKQLNVGGGGNKQVIDENTYLTVDSLVIHDVKVPTDISMKVIYDEIEINDGSGNSKKITGPWEFQFNVSKSEIEKNTKVIKLNRSIAANSTKTELIDLSITPLTTNISYKFKGETPIRFIIKDDNGYELMEEGSGYGTNGLLGGMNKQYKGYESFSAVPKDSKKLYITPIYNYMKTKDNKSKFSKTEPIKWSNKAVTLKQDENNRIIVSNIQRKDGKVYVDFKTEGISVNVQKDRLYLYTANKEQFDIIYYEGNIGSLDSSKEMIHAVFKDKDSSDIYIGTDNMGDVGVIKDCEFTVDLK